MLFVLAATIIMAVPTTAIASSEPVSQTAGTYSLSLSTTQTFSMDVKTLSTAASKSWGITLNLDGRYYVVTFFEVRPLAGDSVGQTGSMNARCYRGYSPDGLNAIRATITSTWAHMSFSVDEKSYVIDSVDAGGKYYTVQEARPSSELGLQAVDEKRTSELAPALFVAETTSSGNASMNSIGLAEPSSPNLLGEGVASVSPVVQSKVDDNQSGPCTLGDPVYRIADIICASDHEYRDLYPSDWENRMVSTVNDLNAKYESQVGITFRICLFHAIPQNWAGDQIMTSELLAYFEDYLNSHEQIRWSPRDLNHLWTGKDIVDSGGGHVPGAAYVAGVRRNVFDRVENVAYSCSEQWHSSVDNLFLIGHEIGHNFNAISEYHAHVGGVWPYYYSTWMGPEEIPFQLGWALEFSDANKARIKAWASQALDDIRTTNPGSSSVNNGLQASNIYLQLWDWGADGLSVHEVGHEMFVGFALANQNAYSVTLQMVFVVARDASGANKDFGHITNVYLGPGEVYYYHTASPWTPTSGGSWDMWPGYKLNNHWGPYQWLLMEPTFYYLQGSEWHGLSTSTEQVDLWYNMEVLSYVPTLTVGSTVTVFCTMFNGNEGTGYTTFTYFFVAVRGAGLNRDFGHSGQQSLAMDCSSSDPTGAGCVLQVTRTIDVSGTWMFWPCYLLNGEYGPSPGQAGWPGITITV